METVSIPKGNDEEISEKSFEEDNRVTIEAELAKLDHAWERRNINPENDDDDSLDELNNELDNFEIWGELYG